MNNCKNYSRYPVKKLIGITAISLPLILYGGGKLLFSTPLQPTFSLYYFTPMRDIFVGLLCILGVLLYLDHYKTSQAQWCSVSAGILAFAIALLPTSTHPNTVSVVNLLHSVSAVVFFSLLAFIALSDFSREATQKRKVYQYCGYTILAMIVAFIALRLATKIIPTNPQTTAVFYLQTIATWAFGYAWLVRANEDLNNTTTASLWRQ